MNTPSTPLQSKLKRSALALAIFGALTSLSGCSGSEDFFFNADSELQCDGSVPFSECTVVSDDDETGGTIITPACSGSDLGVVDACNDAITEVDIHDPVTVNVGGLIGNTQYNISVTDPLGTVLTPIGGFLTTSDGDGEIYRATVIQQIAGTPETGEYSITVTENGETVPSSTINYTASDLSRVRCVDSGATPTTSFLSTENVFAAVDQGSGTIDDGDYDVYVVSDIQTAIADGEGLSGTPSTITIAGGVGSIDLGTFSSGSFDVIVDINGDGALTLGTDLISRHARLLPCFSIQTANSGTAIIEDMSIDRLGNNREIFDPDTNEEDIRDVYISTTPAERNINQTPASISSFVVAHRDTWAGGETLTDISSRTHTSTVQHGNNNLAPWITWERDDLAAGCYDLVVDTNNNGVFDLGTDIVDNQDSLGMADSCGFRVTNLGCSAVAITSHSDGDVVASTAINLTGTVSGTVESAYVTVTADTQSNTINLAVAGGGTFDANIPLFSGNNHITVSAFFTDDTSCSETISIASQSDLALFRAQLTWDGSTDMDLHLVRPNGDYSNGGGGTDDCNFGNCNVGIDGTGSNSIDWGEAGDDDDPKLDVDCISCGNGIENIWMNQINENGAYRVYVDAFSGTENDVTVTVFIRGAAAAQVNCGDMQSGTATDSCFVGTINWSGGSTGNGSFTPSGTKASDF